MMTMGFLSRTFPDFSEFRVHLILQFGAICTEQTLSRTNCSHSAAVNKYIPRHLQAASQWLHMISADFSRFQEILVPTQSLQRIEGGMIWNAWRFRSLWRKIAWMVIMSTQ
jgi:hypothetical protein